MFVNVYKRDNGVLIGPLVAIQVENHGQNGQGIIQVDVWLVPPHANVIGVEPHQTFVSFYKTWAATPKGDSTFATPATVLPPE